jgi:thiamine biosynthesis lipoprotein
VRKLDDDLKIDLGAIGKGYAVDLAMASLDDWDLTAVLIDSGGSTVLARDAATPRSRWSAHLEAGPIRREVRLHDCALAGSGTAVKGAHIFDGRLGQPHQRPGRVWACAKTAALADALSTAFFVLPWDAVVVICSKIQGAGAASVDHAGGGDGEFRHSESFPPFEHAGHKLG